MLVMCEGDLPGDISVLVHQHGTILLSDGD